MTVHAPAGTQNPHAPYEPTAGGKEGPPGPEGKEGKEGKEGPPGAGFNWRGAWNIGVTYGKNEAVSRLGSSYTSIVNGNIGNDPSTDGEVHWNLIAREGKEGKEGKEGPEGKEGKEGKAGPEGKAGEGVPVGGTTGEVLAKKSNTNFDTQWVTPGGVPALEWLNVEAVNAKLEQTVTIQVAVFNGLVFFRGKGKVTAEIAAKGILFTLPLAARPATERSVNCDTATNANQPLNIKTNGEVENPVILATGKTPFFDGMMFSL